MNRVHSATRLLSPHQAAAMLNVSIRTVYRRIGDGSLRSVSVGPRTLRIPAAEIDRIVEHGLPAALPRTHFARTRRSGTRRYAWDE